LKLGLSSQQPNTDLYRGYFDLICKQFTTGMSASEALVDRRDVEVVIDDPVTEGPVNVTSQTVGYPSAISDDPESLLNDPAILEILEAHAANDIRKLIDEIKRIRGVSEAEVAMIEPMYRQMRRERFAEALKTPEMTAYLDTSLIEGSVPVGKPHLPEAKSS